jgi:hypothetical protein
MAVDVLGQMLCKQPALDIGRPTAAKLMMRESRFPL